MFTDKFFTFIDEQISSAKEKISVMDVTLNVLVVISSRRVGNTYEGTTWQIRFKLHNVNSNDIYKFRVSIAAAFYAELQVQTHSSYYVQTHSSYYELIPNRVR